MKFSRIRCEFGSYTDANLDSLSQTIVVAMTGNKYFPEPKPTITVVTNVTAAYAKALALAREGGRLNVALKNAAKLELVDTLRQLGAYVNHAANGDDAMLVSSGFPLVKTPAKRSEMGVPQNLKLVSGMNSGELKASVNSVFGSLSYSFEYTSDPLSENSNWIKDGVSSCQYVFQNLIPGQKYWFRVAAIGPRGQITYSSVISCIVQ